MGYIKSKDSMVIWGKVSGHNAELREFESGKCVTNFSVCYDFTDGGENGRKRGVYLEVKAWNELAHFAKRFERGDIVMVAGDLRKERKPGKDGEDRWYINASMCIPQPGLYEAELDEPEMTEEDGGMPDAFANTEYGADDFPEVLE